MASHVFIENIWMASSCCFKDAFDHDKAKQEGIIVPEKGIDAEYDGVMEDIRERMRDLEAYLHKIRKQLGCEACRLRSFFLEFFTV